MDAELRVRMAIGEMFVQLHMALAEIDKLKARIAELEPKQPDDKK